MRDQQTCTFPQKADSCLLGLWVECRVENVPYNKKSYMSEDSAIVRYYRATININPYLHVETIIYHKENENNPLKSWPTRLVE